MCLRGTFYAFLAGYHSWCVLQLGQSACLSTVQGRAVNHPEICLLYTINTLNVSKGALNAKRKTRNCSEKGNLQDGKNKVTPLGLPRWPDDKNSWHTSLATQVPSPDPMCRRLMFKSSYWTLACIIHTDTHTDMHTHKKKKELSFKTEKPSSSSTLHHKLK